MCPGTLGLTLARSKRKHPIFMQITVADMKGWSMSGVWFGGGKKYHIYVNRINLTVLL
jgi:hypothetical protein